MKVTGSHITEFGNGTRQRLRSLLQPCNIEFLFVGNLK